MLNEISSPNQYSFRYLKIGICTPKEYLMILQHSSNLQTMIVEDIRENGNDDNSFDNESEQIEDIRENGNDDNSFDNESEQIEDIYIRNNDDLISDIDDEQNEEFDHNLRHPLLSLTLERHEGSISRLEESLALTPSL
ncbi:unnamed protein product, partial [Rotaria sp. Silwood1]